MSAAPRYRVVCADGTVPCICETRQDAESMVSRWDIEFPAYHACGPHRIEEVPDDPS